MFNKKSHFWGHGLMFILGAIAGLAAGLFFAPMAGVKLQKKVWKAKDRMVAAVEDTLDNAHDSLRKAVNL